MPRRDAELDARGCDTASAMRGALLECIITTAIIDDDAIRATWRDADMKT